MIYTSNESERNAAAHVAELMVAAARTAPKACGIDNIETLIVDGAEKDSLTAAMREIGADSGAGFFTRDAENVDGCHCIVLVGVKDIPRGLDCAFCGVDTCAEAARKGICCAMAVDDLGIAVGSAAAVAMDHRIDNRILFTAGKGALRLKYFSDRVKVCFGIGLSVSGKNIFFDRPAFEK
jgi:uncharacterized ferredoxin-like protein